MKCWFLSLFPRQRLAKHNAERLTNMMPSGYGSPKNKMRDAIRRGRYDSVQQLAYEYDIKTRQTQQDTIEVVHIPDPKIEEDLVRYKVDGISNEFSGAGEAWEHWQKKNIDGYTERKKKHTFRRVLAAGENDAVHE